MTWRLMWYHFDDLACLAYGNRRELVNRINDIASAENGPIFEILCSKEEQPAAVDTNGAQGISSIQDKRPEPRLIAEVRNVVADVSKRDPKRKHYQWHDNEWPLEVEFADFGRSELSRDIILTPEKIILNGHSVVPRDVQPMSALSTYSRDTGKELRIYSVLHVLDHLIKAKDEGDTKALSVVNKLVNEPDQSIRRQAVLDYGTHILQDNAVRRKIRFDTIELPGSIDIVGFENMGSNATCVCLMADGSFRIDLGLRYVSLASDTGLEFEPVGCGAFS